MIYLTLGVNEDGTGIGGGIGTGGFTAVGGQVITNTFNAIRVNLVGLSGVTVQLLGIWTGKKGKGKIILGFDDAVASQYSIVWPYCMSKGVPITIAMPTSLVGTAGYITAAQATEMYASGMVDFVGHGATHADLTGLSAANCIIDVRTSKNYLLANGYSRGADCMVYPDNAYTAAVLALCKRCGFRFARSTRRYFISDHIFGMDDFMSMGATTLSSVTLATAKLMIDAAGHTGQTLWMYGHNILDQNNPAGTGGAPPGTATNWYKDDFYALVDYIAEHANVEPVAWSRFQAEMLSVPALVM